MTHRTYGDWPGWWIEAGWCESEGGYYYCTVSKFDGEHETMWCLEDSMNRKEITPRHIKEWLEGMAKRWPEMKPPGGYIRHLWDDRGSVGFHKTVKYDAMVLVAPEVRPASGEWLAGVLYF